MTSRARSFLARNAIAFAALFVALGGTGWAVASLPAGSVGSKPRLRLRDPGQRRQPDAEPERRDFLATRRLGP